MKASFVPFLVLLAVLTQNARGSEPSHPVVNVILDTDLATDIDDVGALAVLNALADRGEARILAVMHNTGYPYSVGVISAINIYYGRPEIPIGAYKGSFAAKEAEPYVQKVADSFLDLVPNNDFAPDALSLYRSVLAAQPDQSVVIVSTGFFTNLDALLNSPPDGVSRLDGKSLVAAKVSSLVVMGGTFPAGKNEFNFCHDKIGPVTQDAIDSWPTPIVFDGSEIGTPILVGHTLVDSSPENPVREAFRIHFHGKFGDRPAWDESAVLFAVRGLDTYWGSVHAGYNFIFPNGNNSWEMDNPQHKDHAYLVQKAPPATVAEEIESLLTAN